MERRANPRKPVLMSGAIQFAGCAINCLVRDMTISGAALDVADPHEVPERFNLVFRADGTHIPCHVVWRQVERIGVAFD
ncbi:MAG TPA: PilZ domain-containing protein [Bradyrhizobium sp.]